MAEFELGMTALERLFWQKTSVGGLDDKMGAGK